VPEINQSQQDALVTADIALINSKANFWKTLSDLLEVAGEFLKTKLNEE
jgi:hypothetical protein